MKKKGAKGIPDFSSKRQKQAPRGQPGGTAPVEPPRVNKDAIRQSRVQSMKPQSTSARSGGARGR